MTLIGKNNGMHSDKGDKGFTILEPLRRNPDEGLMKPLFISLALHCLALFVVWIVAVVLPIILAFFGIHLTMFQKPQVPSKDIEFVLVDVEKEETPLDMNTKFRADKNSRAGGINDPKKKISAPSPEPQRLPQPRKGGSSGSPQKSKKTQAQAGGGGAITKADITKKLLGQAGPAPAPKSKPNVPVAPVPIAPRPAAKPSMPKTTTKPTSPMVIPTPKIAGIPTAQMGAGGPVNTSKTYGTGTGGTSKGKASPSFSPTASGGGLGGNGRFSGSGNGSGAGTGVGSGSGRGVSSGYGQAGNPSPGNPNGRPGIDAIKQVDFGPYMRDLQRSIKRNWDPPKGNESKRVVLLFSIARDGRLLGVKVVKSSGLQAADRAAVSAVEMTAPFKPLPSDYKKSSVDIQFTFDYNVFGVSGY